MRNFLFVVLFPITVLILFAESGIAQEPRWQPNVFARGQDRVVIENTPIELRPYRPFHFYGNTVRRIHYRGNPMPTPRDLLRGTELLVRRSVLDNDSFSNIR